MAQTAAVERIGQLGAAALGIVSDRIETWLPQQAGRIRRAEHRSSYCQPFGVSRQKGIPNQ